MVASAENVLKSTENNSKSCEKPLNGRHDMVFLHTYLTEVRMLAPHAPKGQKLLAQGSALGIIAIGKAPCKVGCSKFESKIRYKKWCYFGAAKLLIFNTLIYEIVL